MAQDDTHDRSRIRAIGAVKTSAKTRFLTVSDPFSTVFQEPPRSKCLAIQCITRPHRFSRH